jgi:arylsulfatase
MYKDGWWAACKLDRIPWDLSPATMARFAPGAYDPEQDTWELYYLPDDFSQAHDLATEHPEKLAELTALFWDEAEKHQVLPLLAGFSVFYGILPPMPTTTTRTFHGGVENIASGMIPRVYGRSYAIEAELNVPADGAEGVIIAEGDEMGGFSLWVDENHRLHHSYSMMGVEHYRHASAEPIPTGNVTVRMQFDADRQEPGTGGTVSLFANGGKIGEGRIESTVAVRFSGYAGMDVGRDNGLPVDRSYATKSPYPFTGVVTKVIFDLKPGTFEVEKALHEAGTHVDAARGISA